MARIVVCDDAVDLRLLLRITLEGAGHEVFEVGNGAEALSVLDDHEDLSLVVLDVQMPGMDGWAVLDAIRGHPVHHDLRVVMCTVKFGQEDLARAWELGCDDYLGKPFDLDQLLDIVDDVLSRTPPERHARRAAALAAWSSQTHESPT